MRRWRTPARIWGPWATCFTRPAATPSTCSPPTTRGPKARLFDATHGIGEDPATGSAAGPLGCFLVQHGARSAGRLTITQGIEIGRPSTLMVDIAPDGDSLSVHVGGGVAIVGGGAFDLPG